MPHKNKESYIVSSVKKNILAKTDHFSKYLLIH